MSELLFQILQIRAEITLLDWKYSFVRKVIPLKREINIFGVYVGAHIKFFGVEITPLRIM